MIRLGCNCELIYKCDEKPDEAFATIHAHVSTSHGNIFFTWRTKNDQQMVVISVLPIEILSLVQLAPARRLQSYNTTSICRCEIGV
jgi:hypothetical protein